MQLYTQLKRVGRRVSLFLLWGPHQQTEACFSGKGWLKTRVCLVRDGDGCWERWLQRCELQGCLREAAPLAGLLCASDSWGLLWLSRWLEGVVKEELKWKSLVEKGSSPSEE